MTSVDWTGKTNNNIDQQAPTSDACRSVIALTHLSPFIDWCTDIEIRWNTDNKIIIFISKSINNNIEQWEPIHPIVASYCKQSLTTIVTLNVTNAALPSCKLNIVVTAHNDKKVNLLFLPSDTRLRRVIDSVRHTAAYITLQWTQLIDHDVIVVGRRVEN